MKIPYAITVCLTVSALFSGVSCAGPNATESRDAASPSASPSATESPVASSPASPTANSTASPTASPIASPTPLAQAAGPPVISTGSVPETQGYRKVAVLDGLEHPWGMVWLPDGSMLITERPGRLRIVRNGVLDPTPVAGVPPVLAVNQGGLMDVALHPNFAQNRLIYLTYAAGTESANRTTVARARLEGNRLSDLQVIFEVPQTKSGGQHFGSRIVWLPDGTMLVSIGDGGNPPVQLNGELIRRQAQNRQSNLGKILRLNDDGSIPGDNPFVNRSDTSPAIWSYGHRNIQGLAFDPTTNRIWSTEHGSSGGDELNLIEPGQNYGWPLVTYSVEYGSGAPISNERSRPGLIDPRLVWQEAIAPSGLMVYRGDRFSQWQGNLFAGGLVDRGIRRIEVDANGKVVRQEVIPIGQRVRDVRQGPDGLLYVLTDADNGQLIRLEP